jgi:N-methylhydantoinase B
VELAARGGTTALEQAAVALMDATYAQARALIAKLPRGTWHFEDALDDDGLGNGPLPIRVALTLGHGRVVVDFRGTAPQAAGPVNAVHAVTTAATLYVVRCVLETDLAVNDGLLRTIEVHAPRASLVDPLPPAAVGAGNVETSQRIVDTVMGAFARALPGRLPAASSGTMNNLLIGGHDPRYDKPFAYYETLAGGHGAGPSGDGASAMQAHMTNTRNTPVESLEHAYPLRVQSLRIRRGSGGAGRHVGGDGIERALELLAPARVTVIAERRVLAPWGTAGGGDGAPGRTRVRLARGKRDVTMPGKFTRSLDAGSVITIESPAGGGWGRASRQGPGRRAR